ELKGRNALNQQMIDKIMIDLDGTKNKSNLGANAILAVSLANAKAAANYCKLPFYRYLGGISAVTLPVPMMNILNGGSHASNNIDIQEFMIMPVGFDSFDKGLYAATEVFHRLGKLLKKHNLSTSVGDEGGYAPNLEKDEDAIMYICEAIEQCGYKAGEDFCIALDAAASEWAEGNYYHLKKSGKTMTTDELIDYFFNLCQKYPIISIEDPLGEEDFDGFRKIKDKLESVQIVGDDLFVTSTDRLQKGIDNGSANAILIKFNQVGTLTETIDAVRLAKQNGYNTIMSHRSGETEDTSIADLAVALETGQIKTGAPSRTDRVCKYNRLLKINKNLNLAAKYMNG
ncbi:MAG: phosphopyruvate hydratase, partial [Oscillospiraceae bacterium]|nr:phosphopyruvate hydratase [Oscillospiraceae bacterium]